ncbi:MAG: transcriptional regulator [Verrucomicrobia bacterium]|nr:transcriptional regulator [Verrucomicrobiota bacterium]
MRTKSKLSFKKLPKEYGALCAMLPPRVIHDRSDYENTGEVAEAMAGFETEFTEDQADYFDTLCALLEAYESETAPPLKGTPLRNLKFLLNEHGASGSGLSSILGASRALGPMILRGERNLTLEHVKRLAEHFKVDPALFL